MKILIALLLIVLPGFAQTSNVSPETVVLTVGSRQYTRAEFEEHVRAANGNPADAAAKLANVENLARLRARAEDAKQLKLDQQAALRAKVEMYELAMLNQAYFNSLVDEIHKDESLARKRLESGQSIYEERQIRLILIRHSQSKPVAGNRSPEEALAKANALRAKLLGGASFADTAKTESEDQQTKAKGGDAGLIRKPLLVPEVGQAAFLLKAGEISEPVKGLDGYFLILVEKIVPPAFKDIRKSLEFELARERMAALPVPGVVLNPDYFGKK